MSVAGFEAALRAALNDEAEEEALAVIWDSISRRLPRRVDLGALVFTERTPAQRRQGYQPACIGMMAQIEHYGRPPLDGWGLDYGYRQHIRKGAIR